MRAMRVSVQKQMLLSCGATARFFCVQATSPTGDMRSFKAHNVRKNCISHVHDDTVGCHISVQSHLWFDVRNEY